MAQQLNQIRYVHVNFDTNERGVTIAYFRTEDYVLFGYSLKRKGDAYNKQIGREISKDNLLKNLTWMETTIIDEMDACGSYAYGNMLTRTGALTVEYVALNLDGMDQLSDSTLAAFTMFDFKHSAISDVLKQAVAQIIEEVGI